METADLRSVWTRFHARDCLWGIFFGSVGAVIASTGWIWLKQFCTGAVRSVAIRAPNLRAPIIVASLALLALILPRFSVKSACLFRSWWVGLIRGSGVVWAIAAFCYWTMGKHLLVFVAVGLVFETLSDFKERRRKREAYSLDQIEGWVPRRAKGSVSAIGFDRPIENWEQDAVGRQDFVETVLARVLVNGEPAIGITADFGEGKSSVLHLIRISIDQGKGAIAVPFRTWLPGSEETFLDSLFDTATAAIRTKYFLPSWRSTFRRYGRAVLGVMPKSWELVRDVLPPDSQSSQIEELTHLFSRLPVRVVFLLDEIDRMHEEELTVLLKILRGAPELSNVSYICAFNKEALARLVSAEEPQFGCRYLDKFFPVQLQLPRIDEDLRESLFSDRMSDLLNREQVFQTDSAKKSFEDARNSLWYNALESRLTNFRSVGQVLRGFENSLHVLKNEVNVFDLLVIECLRMLLPSTYEFVYKNGRYFHEPAGGIERWNRTQIEIDQEARKKAAAAALDAYFERLSNDDLDLARDLLSRIFPPVKAYFREKLKGLGSFIIQDLEGERKISDPNFFSRYFNYAVPSTMFGEKEMDEFIAAIHDANEEKIGATVDATLPETDRNDLRRIHFLRRLRDRASRIPDKKAGLLAIAMAERTSDMLSDHVVYQVIKGVVFALAARVQGTPEFQRVLEDAVRKAGSDRFASDIVYSSVSSRAAADEVSNWDGFDPEQIKKVFGDRMRLRHPQPVSEILASNLDDPLAFSRWEFYVPEDTPYLTEFFRSAFDFNIENLGIFLQWLLPGNVTYEGSAIKFIEGFYSPVSDIVQRLKNAEKRQVQWSPDRAAAIKRFWDFLERESPGESESSS
jgi:predicted KAP-like P-loop ATPase